MGFLNFPFPRTDRSFVGHKEVLAFLESYAENFNLKSVIKFENQVVNVCPLTKDRWEVRHFSYFFFNMIFSAVVIGFKYGLEK